jgi:23S rRNA pseudouridine955/2504/2580 synthase
MTAGENKRAARLITVDAESAGRRIDNFLLTELRGVPRARIYSMIRKGEVRVNKGRIKAAHKLKSGDVVRIPPVTLDAVSRNSVSHESADWIQQRILHEDSDFLILDKPSGLAVHGGSGISRGAIELLRGARPNSHFLELVHRLDRDTSGCLLIAKKRSALRRFHKAFREGATEKSYAALLLGTWKEGDRELSLPLVVEHRQNGERFVRPGPEGKEAITRFYPQEFFADTTLMNIELLTGRTHQIRVHAASLGHPVAGDRRYGDAGRDPEGLKRLFLHAAALGFEHPVTGEKVRFEAPLDAELLDLLAKLRRPAS